MSYDETGAFFLLFPLVPVAEWDPFFLEGEDPVLYHHVNVISGQLNLCFEDVKLQQGATSFSLVRTYSSRGALEKSRYSPHLIW